MDISDFQLKKRNKKGTEESVAKEPFQGVSISAQSYFLWVNSEYAQASSTQISADATTTQTLARNNSIALLDKDKNVIDAVAWGDSVEPFCENSPFSQNPNKNQTLGRKWSASDENYIDTNNNSLDFEIQFSTPGTKNQNFLVWLNELASQESYLSNQINFTLHWQSLDLNFSSYLVEYKSQGGEDWQEFYQGDSLEKEFISQKDYVNYYFKVKVLNQNNNNILQQKEIEISVASLPVSLNEIMYAPQDSEKDDYCEYIELYNNTSKPIDLRGWILSVWGSPVARFPQQEELELAEDIQNNGSSLIIKAGGFALISGDVSSDKSIYSGFCEYEIPEYSENVIRLKTKGASLKLPNTGQGHIWLKNPQEQIIDDVLYNACNLPAQGCWGAVGNGKSLQKSRPTHSSVINDNWEEALPGPGIQNQNYDPDSFNILPNWQPSEDYNIFSQKAGHYLFKGNFQVPEGKTLIIEPGVEVYFGSRGGHSYNETGWLTIKGTLKAIGNSQNRIIFAGQSSSTWPGIFFEETSTGSELNWVEVSHAGWQTIGTPQTYNFINGQAVYIKDTDVMLKNLVLKRNRHTGIILNNSNSHLENIEVSMSDGECSLTNSAAVYISGGSPLIKNSIFKGHPFAIYMYSADCPQIEQNTFQENKIPVFINSSYPIFSQNRIINNLISGVFITGSLDTTTWQAPGENFPYVVDGALEIKQGATLFIKSGVVIKFNNNSKLNVKGALLTQGDGEPIVFTSIRDDDYAGDTNQDATSTIPSQGQWDGIVFTSSFGSVLENVIVRYGGKANTEFSFSRGALTLENSKVQIKNASITDNLLAGVQIHNSTSTFENVVFRNHNKNWSNKWYPSVGLYIIESADLSFFNTLFENNTHDIYWPDGGDECQALASSTDWGVECSRVLW